MSMDFIVVQLNSQALVQDLIKSFEKSKSEVNFLAFIQCTDKELRFTRMAILKIMLIVSKQVVYIYVAYYIY